MDGAANDAANDSIGSAWSTTRGEDSIGSAWSTSYPSTRGDAQDDAGNNDFGEGSQASEAAASGRRKRKKRGKPRDVSEESQASEEPRKRKNSIKNLNPWKSSPKISPKNKNNLNSNSGHKQFEKQQLENEQEELLKFEEQMREFNKVVIPAVPHQLPPADYFRHKYNYGVADSFLRGDFRNNQNHFQQASSSFIELASEFDIDGQSSHLDTAEKFSSENSSLEKGVVALEFEHEIVDRPKHSELVRYAVEEEFGVAINSVLLMSQHTDHDFPRKLDACGGTVDSDGRYHYHTLPHCLVQDLNAENSFVQIGTALDGHHIYGPYDEDGVLVSRNSLDECQGTVENGVYRYHVLTTAPYFPTCFRSAPGRVSRTNYFFNQY